MASLLGGGGGGGPLGGVTGAASGLTDGGGPLGGVSDLAGGALGGGALDGVSGLAGGLGGGLLGGGEGLNLIGVVGVGSDEKAILDLNPAQKKEEKAKKMQIARAREQERQKQRKQIEDLMKQQGGKPTDEQKKVLDSLDKSEQEDKAGMEQINRLIPDDVGDGGPPASGLTGGGGPLGAANGLTGGGGPLGAANGLTGGGGPLGAANGLTGGGGPLGAANGLTGGGGPLGAANGLTGGGGPLGAASGLTGGLTGDGGPLGAVGGLTGGLLGSGEGLNLVGLVGVGSDDPALLDLNPAQKKTVKAQKAAEFQKRQQERQRQQKMIEELNRQQGGLTPAQRAQYDKLTADNNADLQRAQNYERWLDQPGTGAAGGGNMRPGQQTNVAGSQGAGGASYSASSGCIPICGHTMNNYAANTGLFYGYLVDAERRDQSKPASYLMTFANADAASQWYSQVSQAGYQVQRHGPQFYSFTGNSPYPVSYDQRFSNSNIGHRMMISGIKQDGCQMVIPPQNERGYLVPHDVGRVAIINGPCQACGGGGGGGYGQNTGNSGSFNNSGFTNNASSGSFGNSTGGSNNTSGGFNNSGLGGQTLPGNQGPLNGINSGSFGNSDTSFGQGSNSFGQGNNSFGQGNNSFGQGSNSFGQGNNSFGQGNNSFGQGSNSFGNSSNSFGNSSNNFGNSSMTSGSSGGGLSLEKAAWIAAQEAKRNGDPRPLDAIARDNYNQLKGSCCGTQQQGGGGIVPASSTGFTNQPGFANQSGIANQPGSALNGVPGQSGQPGQQAGSGGAAGGLGGGLGSTLGGVTGGLGGLGGGLLGSGQGLNVAGIVGLGSDDPALLDLNPADKKAAKQQRMQTLENVKQQEVKKMQDLERQVQQQGGQATPVQKAQYEQAKKNKEAAEVTQQGLANSLPVDDAAIAGLAGGALGGVTGGGGPLGAVGGLGGGLLG